MSTSMQQLKNFLYISYIQGRRLGKNLGDLMQISSKIEGAKSVF